MRFDGKTAFVTGAASGIGRATARRLADEGAMVVVADIDEEGGERTVSLIHDTGGMAAFRHLDVRDDQRIEAVIDETAEEHGLDVLVNNAGIGHPEVPLEHVPNRWRDRVIETNLLAVWNGCQAAIPHMKARGSGAIVNVSSIVAFRGMAGQAAYSLTKAAILNFTRTVAGEVGPDGIRVNAICPGFIETALTANLAQEDDIGGWSIDRIPLRRVGKPTDVASCITFLASDDAAFVTGEALVVDGGATS